MSKVTALTLRERRLTLTLPERFTNPGTILLAGDADDEMILQGFEFGGTFNDRSFTLYGLQGFGGSTGDVYGLTLRPRRMTLEVE